MHRLSPSHVGYPYSIPQIKYLVGYLAVEFEYHDGHLYRMSPSDDDLTSTGLAECLRDVSRIDIWIEHGKRRSSDPARQKFVAEFNINMRNLSEMLDLNDDALIGYPLSTEIRRCFEATWLRAARRVLPTAALHVHGPARTCSYR